jgi:hypothetical protein
MFHAGIFATMSVGIFSWASVWGYLAWVEPRRLGDFVSRLRDELGREAMWAIRFQSGTILVEGASPFELGEGFVHDDRVGAARGPAYRYADVVRLAHARTFPCRTTRVRTRRSTISRC